MKLYIHPKFFTMSFQSILSFVFSFFTFSNLFVEAIQKDIPVPIIVYQKSKEMIGLQNVPLYSMLF